MAPLTSAPLFSGRRTAGIAAAIALAGAAGLAIGLVLDPARAWLAYLMAYGCAFTVAAGALVLLLIGYATGGRWMSVVRRLTEVVALPLPALVVLFVPLLFGLAIYPWHSPPAGLSPRELEVLAHRAPFMNSPFFAVRAFVYLAILLVAFEVLRRASRRRDRSGSPATADDPLARERRFASAMLPAVGLAFTFASIEWLMSLEPVWYSSIFPVYVFAGGFVAAIGLVTALAARAWRSDAGAGFITRHHFHALGRLLLAFVVFWAYAAFFQALLIRIANKPEEVTFYRDRIEGLWAVLLVLLAAGHFALPFLLLLPRALKFHPRVMAAAGWWLLAMHVLDVYWLVIPARAAAAHWVDLAALAAVGGTAVAVAAWRQHGSPLIPTGDPHLAAGAAYRSKL